LAKRMETGYRRRMAKKQANGVKTKPKKFTVYLPGELIRDLKVVAAREGTSCSALVEQYAKEIIKQKAGPGSHP
jgi:predicted HicB family RNase H-like nuclease